MLNCRFFLHLANATLPLEDEASLMEGYSHLANAHYSLRTKGSSAKNFDAENNISKGGFGCVYKVF